MESAPQQPAPATAATPGGCVSSSPSLLAARLLALVVAVASLTVAAEQDRLPQRRSIDPSSAVTPRGAPVPRPAEARLSPSDAARQVQRRYGGRVLSVQAQGGGGYRIKVLKDGEVRTYDIHP